MNIANEAIRAKFSGGGSKTYSPLEFAQKFLVKKTEALPIHDHDSLRDWMDNNGFNNLWDFPIDEPDEILEQGDENPVVLVAVKANGEIESRWYEIEA